MSQNVDDPRVPPQKPLMPRPAPARRGPTARPSVPHRIGSAALATIMLLSSTLAGVVVSRFVIVLAGVREWSTDLALMLVLTASLTATVAVLLCERVLPAVGGRVVLRPRAMTQWASLAAGVVVTAALAPFAPGRWWYAAPSGLVVAASGSIGVGVAGVRARVRARRG